MALSKLVCVNITGVHSNQDQICLVKIGEYIGFMRMAGPDYYCPPYYAVDDVIG